MLERHGWSLHAHPLFLDHLDRLLGAVEQARRSNPKSWQGKADTKLLVALQGLILDRIPRDPLAAEFRQGNTLGRAHRHWFRAKFAGNRFRLFFRADSQAKVIVYAWVNDRDTLRKAGAGTDPYAVFTRMLASGNPPSLTRCGRTAASWCARPHAARSARRSSRPHGRAGLQG